MLGWQRRLAGRRRIEAEPGIAITAQGGWIGAGLVAAAAIGCISGFQKL